MDRVTPEGASRLLKSIGSARVLVVGDLMVDRYVTGTVDRVSPEAPVPVVRVGETRSAPGGAGNVAAGVVALGAGCVVVGCVGDDEAGRALRARLDRIGVGADGVVTTPDRRTTVKTRVTAGGQQIVRFDEEDPADAGDALVDELIGRVRGLAADCDAVVMQDYNKGVLTPAVIAETIRAGGERPVVVDPKRKNFFAYRGVTVFKPNAKELEDALGAPIEPDDPAWMRRTRERLDCDHLLVTLGRRGMAAHSREGGHTRIAAAARSVFDVSGAGDTVTASVGAALAAGAPLCEAAALANHAAAVGVSRAGVATVSSREILHHLRSHTP